MNRILGVLIALILVGDAAAFFTIDDKDAHPSEWDARVEPLVSFVENARDLQFEHPVDVEFLPVDEYRKRATQEQGELGEEEQAELRLFEGQSRALGLIGKDTRIRDELTSIVSEGTAAYYDDVEKKMVIRGTEITVGLRVTIVHELTHALQDQVFGLDRDFATDGADSFFRALAEGDATRIENEYVESLNDADEQAYVAEDESKRGQAQEAVGAVAPALLLFFGAPYALGEQVTNIIVADGGVDALNRLFREPPDNDEGLIDVFALLNEGKTKKVAKPALRAGERVTDSGEIGVVVWYVVLTSFVEPRTALAAVDGWGGDRYIGYRKDNRTCIRVVFTGDTPADTTEMATALNQWKTAFAGNTVQVTATDTGVELDTCEPDVSPTPRADAADALNLPTARLALLNELLSNDVPPKAAECITRNALAQITLERLLSAGQAEQQLVQRIAMACANGRLT